MADESNNRVLVVDDNEAIHSDFRKILGSKTDSGADLAALEAEFFGSEQTSANGKPADFELSFAFQGQQALALVEKSLEDHRPYATAFVDMRMPPGWDGLETIRRLWARDPHLQVVICTAYSDHAWGDILDELGDNDQLLILKKPFDAVEARQAAVALCAKWSSQDRTRRHQEDLEERVARRTAELEQARSEAEAASHAKSEFLANMSHEIRTPLSAVLGYTEFLQDQDHEREPEDTRAQLAAIQRNGEHLLELINDILDLSKIEAQQLLVDRSHCDLREIIEDIFKLLGSKAQGRPIRFYWSTQGAVPQRIVTDTTRLRQILINLLGNALKFTQAGEVHLLIQVGENSTGASLDFSVLDTGIGMDPTQLNRIFQPFCQADTSTTRKFGGTGLGLSLSQRLAQLLGGEIKVESELSRGSCFQLSLPLNSLAPGRIEVWPQARGSVQNPEQAPAPAENPRIPCRVLLVEDGRDNQILISRILRQAGAEVVLADNGLAGVEACRQAEQPFDLVIMDMQMPVMDGYEASRTLRAEDFQAPIVALTAHAMSGDAARCYAAGCSDYATKPIKRQQLLELLARHLPQASDPSVAAD